MGGRVKPGARFWMYVALVVAAVVWLFPIYIAVTKSFDVNGVENYLSVLRNPNVGIVRSVVNSLFMATATALIVLIITSLGGYAFSKLVFPGKEVLYYLLLACMAVPVASVTMPLFFTVKQFGLVNTYAGVIIPMVSFNALMMLMMMRGYFDGIPDEILEAGTVDGANSLQLFTRVVLPMSGPILANVGVLTFVYSWNEYLIPLLMIHDTSMNPVTLATTYFMQTRAQTPEMVAQLYAALVLMTIPSVIVYLLSQRWLQVGISAGAVKS